MKYMLERVGAYRIVQVDAVGLERGARGVMTSMVKPGRASGDFLYVC